MERSGRLTAGSATTAMPEPRDLEVAEEVIHVGIKVHHTTVVVVSSLVRDDAVGLNKRLAGASRGKAQWLNG